MNRIDAYLSSQPQSRLLAACLLLVSIIGAVDFLTGYEMNFAMVYLAPIFITAWTLGTHAAIVMSIIATTAWLVMRRSRGQ